MSKYNHNDKRNDNPAQMSTKYGIFVPFNYMNYRLSAHYIEINKIYHLEMLKKVTNLFIHR